MRNVQPNGIQSRDTLWGIVSDMGDIHFTDLCDFHYVQNSQILDQSPRDYSLIENQMDHLTFTVDYILVVYIVLCQTAPGIKIGWLNAAAETFWKNTLNRVSFI